MGYALLLAQEGDKHPDAKPLTGLRGVIEIVDDYDGDTFRAMYTVKVKKGSMYYMRFRRSLRKALRRQSRILTLLKTG